MQNCVKTRLFIATNSLTTHLSHAHTHSIQGSTPNIFSSYAPNYVGDTAWLGSASEGINDWASPLVEIYDEHQLTAQRERLRQRMEQARRRQEQYRQQSQRRVQSLRPRDTDPFEAYNEQQSSASNVRRRVIKSKNASRRRWQVERDDEEDVGDGGHSTW